MIIWSQEFNDAKKIIADFDAFQLRKFNHLPEKLKIRDDLEKSSQEDGEDSEEKYMKTKGDSHSVEESKDEKEAHKNVLQQGRQPQKQLLRDAHGRCGQWRRTRRGG